MPQFPLNISWIGSFWLDTGEQLLLPDGTNDAPAIASGNNPDTGIRITADGSVRFAAEGIHVGKFNATECDIDVPVKIVDGDAASPALSFDSDQDTGMFQAADDIIGFSTNGVEKLRIGSGGELTVSGPSAMVVYPSYTVATLPTGTTGGMIFVSDETGGATMAYYDGSNWKRVTDGATVS